MMTAHQVEKFGVVVHPVSYYHHAMDYFIDRHELVQFVVASDDKIWCVKNLNRSEINVVFSDLNDAVEDLAMLTMCDDVIISPGTFSYWAGWLNKGTTVYYGVKPKDGTPAATFYANDSFPPPKTEYNNWISIISY